MDKEICLTIAGSDPSGGAGIQADIRTFEKCGVYPLSVITAITFQTADSFVGYKAVPIEDLESQLKVLFDKYKIKYAKTGMIPTIEAVKVISKYFNKYKVNYVVDPITISSAGARLAEKGVEEELKNILFPNAQIITPNIAEAEFYSELKVKSGNFDDKELIKKAGWHILSFFKGDVIQHDFNGVVIKGANIKQDKVLDMALTIDNQSSGVKIKEFEFEKEKTPLIQNIHGTGCVFSSALTAMLARHKEVNVAIINAEQFFDQYFETILKLGDEGLVLSLDYPPEKKNAVEQVYSIYNFISQLKEFSNLIPEVRTNISVSTHNAKIKDHVAAIEGRISVVNGYPKAIGNIKFGVSDHTARLILSAKKFDPSLNIVINMKYVPELVNKLEKEPSLIVIEVDRSLQPTDIKTKEESTMQWVIKNVFDTFETIPDIIWDKGAVGKEPIMRVFAKNAEDMIEKIQKILSYLK